VAFPYEAQDLRLSAGQTKRDARDLAGRFSGALQIRRHGGARGQFAQMQRLRWEIFDRFADAAEQAGISILQLEIRRADVGQNRQADAWTVEHAIGLRCIAAPIFDETGDVVAAVSTTGRPMAPISDERMAQLGELVLETARAICADMGAGRQG
jgi:hypothetical protein